MTLYVMVLMLVWTCSSYAQSLDGGLSSRAISTITDGTHTCNPYKLSVNSVTCSNGIATISGGGSMTWPASAGVANYSGSSSWGTSYSTQNPASNSTLETYYTVPANSYLSTMGGQSGNATSTGADVVSYGQGAAASNTTGSYVSAFGWNALTLNTTGTRNTCMGMDCLANLAGNYSYNTALGFYAGLYYTGSNFLTTPVDSTFLGAQTYALANGDTNETVVGYGTIGNGSNTVSLGNSSVTGVYTQGNLNTVATYNNLEYANNYNFFLLNSGNTTATGTQNYGLGQGSLSNLGIGSSNFCGGASACMDVTSGGYNVSIGANSNFYNQTGSSDTSLGMFSLQGAVAGNWSNMTAIGYDSNSNVCSSASADTTIGYNTQLSTCSDTNEVVIGGNGATGNGSNTTTIGNSSTTATYIPHGTLNLPNYSFPSAIGTSNQVLTSPSSGSVLTWSTPSGSMTWPGSAGIPYYNGTTWGTNLALTTTGTSGAATLSSNTLNIPQYATSMAIGNTITSASQGSVLFAGASGVLAQDNSKLYWNDTNGYLGINTSGSPAHPLDVPTVITNNSTGRIGDIELQTYGLNNSWFGENVYYNGSNFVARQTGSMGMFYFQSPEGQFRFCTSATSGSAFCNSGNGDVVLKMNADGTVALGSGGSSMPTATGSYSGSTLLVGANGHIATYMATAPVLSSCGSSPSITGSDTAFVITVGSTATGCTATFNKTWTSNPVCTVTNQSQSIVSAMTYTVSTTAVTISQAAGLSGNIIDVICLGAQDGT